MSFYLNFYKGKNIFITGHTGFKGSWLVQILKKSGANITGYSLAPESSPSLFSAIDSTNINSVIADIRDLQSLKQAMTESNPEIVIHMAAQPIVLESYSNPVYTYDVNVMGTVNILESLRSCKNVKSFLNVTTDKVYLNNEWHWPYRENETLCGSDPYSNSKSCSELVTYGYKKSFFSSEGSPAISTARSGNVIGGGDFAKDRIIPDCIRAAEKKSIIEVRNPYSIRPYQHVMDSLSGYLLLLKKQYENKNKYSGSYNFGPDASGCITTGELVETFCKKWGNGQTWEYTEQKREKESSFLRLDSSLAAYTLGHKNRWNIEDAVEKTVEWSKAYLAKENISVCMDRQIEEYFHNV